MWERVPGLERLAISSRRGVVYDPFVGMAMLIM